MMEAIGRFSAGVAHEFNNVLTVMIGDAELALGKPALDAETRGGLEEIRDVGYRGANLSTQLLAFGRRQSLIPVPVVVNALVGKVDQILRRVIGEDITLTVALGSDVPTVKVDPGQLELVLMNLAASARDAMPAGGSFTVATRRFVLRSKRDDLPGMRRGVYAELTTSDTGAGLDESTLRRVFEPFSTTGMPGLGTGLGLAAVYGSVRQSGGFVYATSAPGRGTTFTIFLPAMPPAKRAAHASD
jgi:signal transduction histidine kinase